MSDKLTLDHVFAHEHPLVDVIFVHGLTGDPHDTWAGNTESSFWPEWLDKDLDHLTVYTLGYPARAFRALAIKEMNLFERATSILETLAGHSIGKRPIVFVAHSLGGILVKMLLRKSSQAEDEDWHRISQATKLVVFIATPHTGSALANVFKSIPRVSTHVDLLAKRTGVLEDLNHHYRVLTNQRTDLSTAVYYETHRTHTTMIVSRDSADPGISNVEPVPVDKDHISICKPLDKNDIVYLGIKRHIRRVVESVRKSDLVDKSNLWVEEYGERAAEDRRDLLQKLIDAGREHEYNYTNNAQNRFARRYTKTGLLTAARQDHEKLLAEIETRFVTHVYHPLICMSGSAQNIRTAVQESVIDPLSRTDIGGTRFSAKAVLSALYFLTEQCYIRWDRPK